MPGFGAVPDTSAKKERDPVDILTGSAERTAKFLCRKEDGPSLGGLGPLTGGVPGR